MSNKQKPSLNTLISSLEKNKLPSRDLWTGIEYGLSQASNPEPVGDYNTERHNTRLTLNPMMAIAASIFIVVLIGYFSFESGRIESGQTLIAQMSEQHAGQKKALLASFVGQPATTVNWQIQLEELDKAAVAIKKALKNEPNNAALLSMLQRVHEQQISLIERVHAPAWHQI